MTRHLTQAELADQLGLARATVNRILNGHRGHKVANDETVARVLAAADAAGYAAPGAPERPSMAEIGRQLGLSHVTVHAVLRDKGRRSTIGYSAETRARVLAKAKELGYEPPALERRQR